MIYFFRCNFSNFSCKSFLEIVNTAKTIAALREQTERNLQLNGYVLEENDLGFFGRPKNIFANGGSCDASTKQANVLNIAAKLIADRNHSTLNYFENFASCLSRSERQLGWRPKYRSINGYGNNLKHPHWGTPGMPFGRLTTRNYDDGVSSIRKSVTGSDLPSPRKLVLDVMLKVEKYPRTKRTPTYLVVLLILYISHDLAHTVPVEAFNNGEKIRCCESGNKGVLPPSLSHSACLPISVSKNDPFYRDAGIRCLPMVRSEPASSPSTIQFGEIKNMATAYMDHSLIYGIEEEQMRQTRTFCRGKLNLGKNQILPIDDNGRYIKSSDRLTLLVPLAAVWAGL
jgi:Animal haem peroxidase